METFIWSPDVPASSQASPHLQTPPRNMQAQCPGAPCVKWDETSPPPPLPLGSLLEDGEDAAWPVLPQSFPLTLSVLSSTTLWGWEANFSKTVEVEEVYFFFFLDLSNSSEMFLMKRQCV